MGGQRPFQCPELGVLFSPIPDTVGAETGREGTPRWLARSLATGNCLETEGGTSHTQSQSLILKRFRLSFLKMFTGASFWLRPLLASSCNPNRRVYQAHTAFLSRHSQQPWEGALPAHFTGEQAGPESPRSPLILGLMGKANHSSASRKTQVSIYQVEASAH